MNTASGSLLIRDWTTPPWEVDPKKSCALDVAEGDPVTLDEAGELLGVTRERIRQLESTGLAKVKRDVEYGK